MTDTAPIEAPDTASAPVICTCCPHPEASHDETSRRYCQATQQRALTRGCICS